MCSCPLDAFLPKTVCPWPSVRVTHESAARFVPVSVQSFPGIVLLIQCFCFQIEPDLAFLAWTFSYLLACLFIVFIYLERVRVG